MKLPLPILNISTSNSNIFASILSKYCIDELIATECGKLMILGPCALAHLNIHHEVSYQQNI